MDVAVKTSPVGYREVELETRADASAESAEYTFTASSEAPVMRYFWTNDEQGREIFGQFPEILLHSREAVDLSGLHSVLYNHNPNQIVGPVRSAALDGKTVRVRAGWDDDEDSRKVRGKVQSGSLRGVSVGYQVHSYRFVDQGQTFRGVQGPAMVATKWRAFEVSLTPIPADGSVGIGRNTQSFATVPVVAPDNMEVTAMARSIQFYSPEDGAAGGGAVAPPESQPQAPAAPAQRSTTPATNPAPVAPAPSQEDRIREISTLCEIAQVSAEETLRHITSGNSVEQVRSALQQAAIAQRQQRPAIQAPATAGADERDKFRSGAVAAILLRGGLQSNNPDKRAQLEKQAGEFRGLGLRGIARRSVAFVNGLNSRMDDDAEELFRAAMAGRRDRFAGQGDSFRAGPFNHTTSDFPLILADAVNKALQAGYMEAPVTYNQWVRTVSFSDFKTRYVNRLSEAPDPQTVNQNGEIREVALSEQGENYTIDTVGEIISITRKTLINDDLSAFSRVPAMMGAAFRRKIQKSVSDIINRGASAYAMSDGNQLFDASNHSNYGTTGTALSQTTLNAAITAMRKQTGIGGEPIAVEPRFLLIPPDLELTAYQIINATLIPTTAANLGLPNPPSIRSLIPIIDRFMSSDVTGGSATAYAIVADNTSIDTVELGLLNGVDAPAVEEEEGFDILGMRLRAYLDYGVKPIDWRGMSKRTGAA